jgi:hypothetical protein
LLRAHYREYKPAYWLFEGQHGGTKKHNTAHHYDLTGNILKILERSVKIEMERISQRLI